MSEKTVPAVPVGSNPYLEDEALCDVLSRVGFLPEHVKKLVNYWCWWDGVEFCPDDLASALMHALPPETAEQAEKRRSLCRMGVTPVPFMHEDWSEID